MFYENELNFLRDVFRKCRVNTFVGESGELVDNNDIGLKSIFGKNRADEFLTRLFSERLDSNTVYRLTDGLGLSYSYLLLPPSHKGEVLFIGPYLKALPSKAYMLELGEKNGISPKRQRYLEEYYESIPVLSEGNYLFTMLSVFCERIWDTPSFSMVEVDNNKYQTPVLPVSESLEGDDFDDVIMNMKALERRYEFENEMIQAVSLGQLHKEDRLLNVFSSQAFEKRVADPLRNAQNYDIIMNTLLRKAAEKGGVHPIYIDKVSSEFASKIEHLSSLSENAMLMREMFRSYCRLVRRHTMKNLSAVVQRAMLLIDSDLSANLSLKTVAENQNVSLGYLSDVFRRETGKTISEYIRARRIGHAKYLLSTTQLQIQTVALHCGIVDVHYFSKTFKKETGKTPKEYRKAHN